MRSALAAGVLLVVALAARGGEPGTAADDVTALRELVRARKWEDGRAAVARLLEAHRDDPDLRPLLGDVEELLQRCLFGAIGTPIDTGVAIGPGVVKYVPSTRAVVIETSPESARRWLREPDGTRTLPVPFEGDVSVEVAWGDADDWSVLVGWDPDAGTGWRVEVRAQDHSASPGRVVRMGADGEKLLGPVAAPRTKEPASVRVSRVGAAIAVTADRVQLAQEVANGARRAFVALRPSPDTEPDAALPPVRIAGRVDARFARRAVSSAESMGFAWWRASAYRRESALPAWVLDLERASRGWTERAPVVPAERTTPYRDALRACFENDLATLRRRLDELRDAELPESARALLEALEACADDRPGDATPVLRKLHESEPGSASIAAALGVSLRLQGALAEADAAFAAARAADPAYAPAYDGAAEIRFAAGDLDGARAILDAAARAGTSSETTARLRSHVDRARRGPAWPKRVEREAGPFRVAGDVPRATLDAAAKFLAEASAEFAARVRPLPDGTRLRAWVFSDETAYADWCRDGHLDVEEDAAFLPAVREVCVCVGADGTADGALVRRAVFEACVQALGARARWLETGLPRALAAPGGAGGLARRYAARFFPWNDVFCAGRDEFTDAPDVFRAQSVAAARVLLDPRDAALRGVLAAYLDALRRGEPPNRAYTRVIEPVLAALQREVAGDR